MAQIKLTPIFGRPWDLRGFKSDLEKSMREEGRAQKKLFAMTTATWKGAKPRFNPKRVISSTEISVTTGPSGNEKAVNKWGWLDQGTAIRWALMSGNWRSKTVSKRLKSRRGSGKVLIAGRRAMQKRNIKPRKGIKARGWTKIIEKRRRKKFVAMMKRDFRKLSRSAVGKGTRLPSSRAITT